jgi:hypothetical protein
MNRSKRFREFVPKRAVVSPDAVILTRRYIGAPFVLQGDRLPPYLVEGAGEFT